MLACRYLVLCFAVALPVVLLGGCPLPAVEPTPPAATSLPLDAGMYWVEYGKGRLAIYVLPEARGESGRWHVFSTAKPDWYTGPALYQVREDGGWERRTDGNELTLDEIIQLHDPAPAAP